MAAGDAEDDEEPPTPVVSKIRHWVVLQSLDYLHFRNCHRQVEEDTQADDDEDGDSVATEAEEVGSDLVESAARTRAVDPSYAQKMNVLMVTRVIRHEMWSAVAIDDVAMLIVKGGCKGRHAHFINNCATLGFYTRRQVMAPNFYENLRDDEKDAIFFKSVVCRLHAAIEKFNSTGEKTYLQTRFE